jgi:hypothetical protein
MTKRESLRLRSARIVAALLLISIGGSQAVWIALSWKPPFPDPATGNTAALIVPPGLWPDPFTWPVA